MHTCKIHFYTSVNTYIATYSVQGAEISEGGVHNSICITCIFAQGTSALGCFISLLENHDSKATNTTGLRIEREGDSLNATGCIEDLEGGLYHVVVYDVEADGTVDWDSKALSLTTALNLTIFLDQLSTGKSVLSEISFFYLVCFRVTYT